MRVSARTKESLRPIFVPEDAIRGWTLDWLPSFSCQRYERPDLRRNCNSIFCHQRSLRAFLRSPLGAPHGNNHRRDHRATAVCVPIHRHDPAGEILRTR